MSEYIYGSREKIKPPCKDCQERHPHCHSECEAYLAYDADRQRIRKEKKVNSDMSWVLHRKGGRKWKSY